MAEKPNAFADAFFELLKRFDFPASDSDILSVLLEHHAVVTEMNNRVLALVSKSPVSPVILAATGIRGGGGGGPHLEKPWRLDLVLQYSITAPEIAIENTQKLHEEFFSGSR